MTNYSAQIHHGIKRFFLMRRRWDPLLLGLAAATAAFHTPIDVVILAVFWGIGAYLIVFRHGSIRRLDPVYCYVALAFAASAMVLSAVNGGLFDDFRWASYPAYYLAAMPIAVGTVLIRDPVRCFVLGARIGITLACLASIVLYLFDAGRIGFGSNAANAAFSLAFLGVVTRFGTRDAPRWLPDSSSWFYLSIIPVLLTGTRIVLPVYLLALVFDGWILLRSQRDRSHPNRRVVFAAAILALGVSYGASDLIEARIDSTIQEFQALDENPLSASGGLSIRIVLWKAALDIISEHPFTGIGGANVQEAMLSRIPEAWQPKFANYTFSHNFMLDEVMQRGFPGLFCLLAFFGFVFFYLARGEGREMITNLVILYTLLLVFGSMHYLLLVDRHVGLIAVWFSLLVTGKRLAGHQYLADARNAATPLASESAKF